MGIDGLWELLEPAATICTLNDICLMNGFSSMKKNNILRIGVDISVIMNECIAVEHCEHLYQYRTLQEFCIFLFKLCKFLRKAPVIMIFVFDGPNWPSFKRSKDINTENVPGWLNHCKTIIEAFGFYWHQAPGEADAELGMLSHHGIIDIILTKDSDAFAFKGQCVIKHVGASRSLTPNDYILYSMDAIENIVGLSYGGILLVALLSNSDYSKGLIGCGSSISAALARCGFGDRLLHAFEKLEGFKLQRELESITVDIQAELRSNSHNFLNSRCPMLASKFTIDIIAPDKVAAFLNPVVSTTFPSPSGQASVFPTWLAKEPSIPQIGRFCMHTLNWPRMELDQKLGNILWPGVFLCVLTSPLVCVDNIRKLYAMPNTQTVVHNMSPCKRQKNKAGLWAHVEYTVDNFRALLGVTGNAVNGVPDMKVWVPVEYLPAGLLLASARDSKDDSHSSVFCSKSALVNTAEVSQASSSALTLNGLPVKSMSMDLTSPSQSSASPDPPSQILEPTHNHPEIMEITDSDSEVEIIRSPHPCRRSFSPEVIVISD